MEKGRSAANARFAALPRAPPPPATRRRRLPLLVSVQRFGQGGCSPHPRIMLSSAAGVHNSGGQAQGSAEQEREQQMQLAVEGASIDAASHRHAPALFLGWSAIAGTAAAAAVGRGVPAELALLVVSVRGRGGNRGVRPWWSNQGTGSRRHRQATTHPLGRAPGMVPGKLPHPTGIVVLWTPQSLWLVIPGDVSSRHVCACLVPFGRTPPSGWPSSPPSRSQRPGSRCAQQALRGTAGTGGTLWL